MNSFGRKVFFWQLSGFAAVTLVGSLLHFLYEWAGESSFVGAFSAVNESTWEHMKLLFFPMLLFTLIEGIFFREVPCFFQIKFQGTLLGLVLIPVLFYTYNGVFGTSPAWVNISVFFLAALVAFVFEGRRLVRAEGRPCSVVLPLLGFALLAGAFVLFTYRPPMLPLFRDPLTGGYGIG